MNIFELIFSSSANQFVENPTWFSKVNYFFSFQKNVSILLMLVDRMCSITK